MKPKSLPSMFSDRNSAAGEPRDVPAAEYHRHENRADHQESLQQSGHNDDWPGISNSRQNERRRREVRFAFLPDRYEPLVDELAQAKAKERKARKKKQLKKVKKSVGKAFRVTWKCLMLGLYNFANGCSTPITVAAAFVPGRSTT